MRWILLGLVLGLLIVYPALAATATGVAAWLAGQPAAIAFVLGLLARPHLTRLFAGSGKKVTP